MLTYTDNIVHSMVSEVRTFVKGNPKRLRIIRRKLRLSQGKFAQLLGVRTNTYARWERGDLVPSKVAELAAEHLLTTQPKKGGKK